MSRNKHPSNSDDQSRSKREGGVRTLSDAFRGPRTGYDGAIHGAIWGSNEQEYDEAIEYEMAHRQRRSPAQFVNKIAPYRGRKAKGRHCRT